MNMNINPPNDSTPLPIVGEGSIGGIHTYVENKVEINRLETPTILNPQTTSFKEIEQHALLRQRLSPKTVLNHLKYLRFMETHPIPIDLRNPTHKNFLQHMDYREQIEHAGNGALKHEKEAYYMYLRAIGRNPLEFYYKPPRREAYTAPVPYPEQVHQMIHQRYTSDDYTNALIRYLLCHNHIIGWRPPSEPIQIHLNDIDLDHGLLTVTMPKLHNRRHQVDIQEISIQHDTPSMRNWIDIWRPRVENQYSLDFLYLTPEGKPFTGEGLRHFLYQHARPIIQEVFPEYYNYTSRHWCAVAHLIRTKLRSGSFDIYEVMNHLGHSKVQTTISYTTQAKNLYDVTEYDWIDYVLGSTKTRKQHRLNRITPVETIRRPPNPPQPTGEDGLDNTGFSWVVENKNDDGDSDLSPSSFSFNLIINRSENIGDDWTSMAKNFPLRVGQLRGRKNIHLIQSPSEYLSPYLSFPVTRYTGISGPSPWWWENHLVTGGVESPNTRMYTGKNLWSSPPTTTPTSGLFVEAPFIGTVGEAGGTTASFYCFHNLEPPYILFTCSGADALPPNQNNSFNYPPQFLIYLNYYSSSVEFKYWVGQT